MSTISLGLFGTGVAADYHAFAISKSSCFTLSAVADYSLSLSRDFATRHHIGKYYGDLEYLLNDDSVDMVVVASPTNLHFDAFPYIASTGRSIIMETPLSSQVLESEDMIKTAEEEGIYLFPVSVLLSDPLSSFVREKIKTGELGKIESYSLSWSFPSPVGRWIRNWKGDFKEKDLFFQSASPLFDLLFFWMGKEEVRGVERIEKGYRVIFERGKADITDNNHGFSFSLYGDKGIIEGKNGKLLSSITSSNEFITQTISSSFSLLPLWYREVYKTLESGVWSGEKCKCSLESTKLITALCRFQE